MISLLIHYITSNSTYLEIFCVVQLCGPLVRKMTKVANITERMNDITGYGRDPFAESYKTNGLGAAPDLDATRCSTTNFSWAFQGLDDRNLPRGDRLSKLSADKEVPALG